MAEFKVPRRSSHARSEGPALRSAVVSSGAPPTWTTGAKDGIGTAYYHPGLGSSQSNVWYTLSRGHLTEVYYPDVSCANLRQMQCVVSDGRTFVDIEEDDTLHEVVLVYSDALVYQQINTAKNGKYRIEKMYTTDPKRHVLLINITFHALVGSVSDYNLFISVNPLVNNGATDVQGRVEKLADREFLIASSGGKTMAVCASSGFGTATVGHVGVDDGLQELQQRFVLLSQQSHAEQGNLMHIAELRPSATYDNAASFVVAIAFGESDEEAAVAANGSIAEGFTVVLEQYRREWSAYLKRLKPAPVGSEEQYNVSVMTLKAHEDKLHPGAVVASLTIPWGDNVVSTSGGIGGYHLVWSRDFYQVMSAMIMIGDLDFARRSIAYLDDIQQRPDGSFPQNSWLDGTPYWPGLQMDEVAYPILLLEQLGDCGRYESLVKPAADFIVENGPYTPQERWEENAGYSPSTLAAQIAALVVAAKMARKEGDNASAASYLATADEWDRNVEQWTVTSSGSLSEGPYYIRISDTKHPDDGHWTEIKNGGGWHAKSDVVDAGFLELVRLGIRSADNPIITHSIDVIDEVLRFNAPYGPVWRRYNFDGYGEHEDGRPYDGQGIGRPWPVLAGERGEYEVALAASEKRSLPSRVYGAERLLESLAGAANHGYMIPEQIWDGEDLPQWHLKTGGGTGSATPLAWAMAQYIRLTHCIAQGRIVEMIDEVANRYLHNRPPLGPAIQIISPQFSSILDERRVRVSGLTAPGATVMIHSDKWESAVADANGQFHIDLSLWSVGENRLDFIAYDNHRAVSTASWLVHYEPETVFLMSDPVGDDKGPGWYSYPTHPDFCEGDFDLEFARVLTDDRYAYFEIGLVHLDDPWEGMTGISKQLIDIYLYVPGINEPTTVSTRGLRANFVEGGGWNRAIRISGNWHGEVSVVRADGSTVGDVMVQAQYPTRSVCARVNLDALGAPPETGKGWRMMAVVAGEENGVPRPIRDKASEWDFGGGDSLDNHPLILDMLMPPGQTQKAILDWTTRACPVDLPMIELV